MWAHYSVQILNIWNICTALGFTVLKLATLHNFKRPSMMEVYPFFHRIPPRITQLRVKTLLPQHIPNSTFLCGKPRVLPITTVEPSLPKFWIVSRHVQTIKISSCQLNTLEIYSIHQKSKIDNGRVVKFFKYFWYHSTCKAGITYHRTCTTGS